MFSTILFSGTGILPKIHPNNVSLVDAAAVFIFFPTNGKEIVSTISKNLDSVIYSSNDYLSSGHLMAAMSLSGC